MRSNIIDFSLGHAIPYLAYYHCELQPQRQEHHLPRRNKFPQHIDGDLRK